MPKTKQTLASST